MLSGPAWDAYWATNLAIGATWFYFAFKSHQNPKRDLRTSIFLLAHTIYILYLILIAKPENIFHALDLPINTPPDSIKALLVQRSEFGDVPKNLGLLLERLGSFDMRLLYVRSEFCLLCRSQTFNT